MGADDKAGSREDKNNFYYYSYVGGIHSTSASIVYRS